MIQTRITPSQVVIDVGMVVRGTAMEPVAGGLVGVERRAPAAQQDDQEPRHEASV